MQANTKILISATLIALLCSTIVYLLCQPKEHKIMVVDAIKLFNGFKMKQEMEAQDAVQLKQLNSKVDSLESILQIMQKNSPNGTLDRSIVYEYQLAKSNSERAFEDSNREINEQVWKRLNVLIALFGKERKLGIIVGANGMGSVLYNEQQFDATEAAIQYVNKQYENKK